mmetsp:Transcript_15260/g.38046  ORF Transcript_15260/g.38046 Transcript_15260/m.38046 type:complete len:224 (+) Transcript_15260:1010-1681(+)
MTCPAANKPSCKQARRAAAYNLCTAALVTSCPRAVGHTPGAATTATTSLTMAGRIGCELCRDLRAVLGGFEAAAGAGHALQGGEHALDATLQVRVPRLKVAHAPREERVHLARHRLDVLGHLPAHHLVHHLPAVTHAPPDHVRELAPLELQGVSQGEAPAACGCGAAADSQRLGAPGLAGCGQCADTLGDAVRDAQLARHVVAQLLTQLLDACARTDALLLDQ